MSVKSIVLSTVLLSNVLPAFANDPASPASAASDTAAKNGAFNQAGFGFLASYTDFKFDSSTATNFNRFTGHSTLYSTALGNVKLTPNWIAGLALFSVVTSVRSQISVAPGQPATSEQATHNNTIFAHVLREAKYKIFLDLSGAYGQNKVNSTSWVSPNTKYQQIGQAHNISSNWFVSLMALYSHPWHKFSFNPNIRLLYSQVNSGNYTFEFAPTLGPQTVTALTNKALFLTENIEIDYTLDTKMSIKPFINGGLLQVLYFSNSRPLIAGSIIGPSPQLDIRTDGYRLGGGVTFQHKRLSLRIEEQYYSSGGNYTSYQTLAGLRYTLD
jgi:hypothetical protein